MTEVIHRAHGDEGPNDTIYGFVEKAANAIWSADANDEDSASDAIYEIESDIYTSDLTAWLHESPSHVYYLNEALEEYGDIRDGFQLLGLAQSKQIQEVGQALLSVLLEQEAGQEDED